MVSAEKRWFKGKSWSAESGGSIAIADLDPVRVRRAVVAGVAALIVLAAITVALIRWGPGSHEQLVLNLIFVVLGALFAGIGGFCLAAVAPMAGDRARLIATTPTATAAAVLAGEATGTVELIGTAAADTEDPSPLLAAPLSGTRCLYFGVTVVQVTEERSQRADSSWSTSQRRITVASESSDRPFWLADATGRVRLVPVGAEVVGRITAERQEDPRAADRADDLLAGELRIKGVRVDLPWRTGGDRVLGYEITEQAIAPGDPLYVIGPVGRYDFAAAIAATGEPGTFLIRVGTEEDAIAAARSQERLFRLVGTLFAAIGGIFVVVGLVLVITI